MTGPGSRGEEAPRIYVYMKEPRVSVLGPGVRYVLWVQGCEKSCPGCIAENGKVMSEGSAVSADALALEIASSGAEGLTVSGGEPFLQADALAHMIDRIRKRRDMGVIVYTGYLYEELKEKEAAARLLRRIDLLIDGPYIEALNDGKSLRGSSNQRVIPLTERYLEEAKAYGRAERLTEVFYHGSRVHRVGIPKRNEEGKGEDT